MIKKNNIHFDNSGQSMLEVVVALAIFAIIAAAMSTMVVGGYNGLIQGGEQTEAESLAQEAMEALRSIHNKEWNKIKFSQVEVYIDTGQWKLKDDSAELDGETIGQYTRWIYINDTCRDSSIDHDIVSCPPIGINQYIDQYTKKVTINIDWTTMSGSSNRVKKVEYLTNWDSKIQHVKSDNPGSDNFTGGTFNSTALDGSNNVVLGGA